MINTLQLTARKNLIQMSSDVINYNSNCHSEFQGTYQQLALIIFFSIPEKQLVQKHEAKRVALCLEAEGRHFEHLL
jgi:hypothetical protein